MHSFREVVDVLERRDGRLRGTVCAGWVLAAAACLALVLALIFTLLGHPLPRWVMPLLAAASLAIACVAFLLGGRAQRPRARLLLEVDVRLGLDARLSSLHEIEERGGPRLFGERLFRDIVDMTPDWKRALPIPGRLPFLAATTLVTTMLAFGLPLLSLHPSSQDPITQSPPAATAPATIDSPNASGAHADDEAASELDPVASRLPASSTGSISQRTLSEILSELRPALAGSSAAWAPGSDEAAAAQSEAADAALRQELEQLQKRLAEGDQPPSAREMQALREAAAATSPDLSKTIEEAAASADLDALRQTISQLLSPSASQAAPTANATRSDVRPSDEAEATDTASDSPPPPDAGSDGASSGASAGTQAGSDASAPLPDETPLFESGVGNVAPVAPPLVLGQSGDVSSYITSGVPIEQAPDAADPGALWTLSPGKVQSLLSARDLPAGAAEIIRDYFQRITEETP